LNNQITPDNKKAGQSGFFIVFTVQKPVLSPKEIPFIE